MEDQGNFSFQDILNSIKDVEQNKEPSPIVKRRYSLSQQQQSGQVEFGKRSRFQDAFQQKHDQNLQAKYLPIEEFKKTGVLDPRLVNAELTNEQVEDILNFLMESSESARFYNILLQAYRIGNPTICHDVVIHVITSDEANGAMMVDFHQQTGYLFSFEEVLKNTLRIAVEARLTRLLMNECFNINSILKYVDDNTYKMFDPNEDVETYEANTVCLNVCDILLNFGKLPRKKNVYMAMIIFSIQRGRSIDNLLRVLLHESEAFANDIIIGTAMILLAAEKIEMISKLGVSSALLTEQMKKIIRNLLKRYGFDPDGNAQHVRM